MISINMTIREAVAVASLPQCSGELYNRIVAAIEDKCGEGGRCVTIKAVGVNRRLDAIKAIRCYTGWGLKEAKDLVDDVMAWNRTPGTGRSRDIFLDHEKAQYLLDELRSYDVMAEID